MPLTVWPHCLIFCCCIPILIAMFPYTPQQNILMAAVQDAMCLSMTDFLCFKEPYMRTKLFVLYYLWLRTDEFVIYRHISRFFFFWLSCRLCQLRSGIFIQIIRILYKMLVFVQIGRLAGQNLAFLHPSVGQWLFLRIIYGNPIIYLVTDFTIFG